MIAHDVTMVASKGTADLPLWSPAALPEFVRLFRWAPEASSDPVDVLPSSVIRTARVVTGQTWVAGGDLAAPVPVRISGSEGASLVVTHEPTGIYGVGPDIPSAITDFREALVEHREVLLASGPLVDDLQDQLRFLQRHLRPNAE